MSDPDREDGVGGQPDQPPTKRGPEMSPPDRMIPVWILNQGSHWAAGVSGTARTRNRSSRWPVR